MHVRLASINSLTSSGGGGSTPNQRGGRSDSLPDSDMHCLPVNPTTKLDFGSLEGLMLVTTLFFKMSFNTKKDGSLKKKQQQQKQDSIPAMQPKMADTMLL